MRQIKKIAGVHSGGVGIINLLAQAGYNVGEINKLIDQRRVLLNIHPNQGNSLKLPPECELYILDSKEKDSSSEEEDEILDRGYLIDLS